MSLKALEIVTTLAMLAVAAALGWMIVASAAPETVGWTSMEAGVIVIVAILAAALILVSLAALLQTRSRDLP
jgi:hypothetical protein